MKSKYGSRVTGDGETHEYATRFGTLDISDLDIRHTEARLAKAAEKRAIMETEKIAAAAAKAAVQEMEKVAVQAERQRRAKGLPLGAMTSIHTDQDGRVYEVAYDNKTGIFRVRYADGERYQATIANYLLEADPYEDLTPEQQAVLREMDDEETEGAVADVDLRHDPAPHGGGAVR